MIIEFSMPALSPTMEEGTLAKWVKKEGDKIAPGEVIAEIETDKATMEVEAVDEGILAKILVSENSQNVKVGTIIALIIEEESDRKDLESYVSKSIVVTTEKPVEIKPEPKSESKNIPDNKEDNSRIFASPLAKRIASQNSVDLSKMQGSGPHGRIIKSDILSVLENGAREVTGEEYEIVPISNMRKVIAKRLLESKQTIPHFYLNIECNLDKLLAIREEVNMGCEKEAKISVNDFVIKATSMALNQVPEANSGWSDDGIILYKNIDISVAVAISGGLVTPIIKSANSKTISDISKNMKELATKARDGKLKPEEYQGGSFTISNLGMYGIKNFSAIINPPQSCIIAVGAGIKKPIIDGNEIKVATMCEVTLSCDHRVVDGAIGAKFLSAFRNYIENPVKMLI